MLVFVPTIACAQAKKEMTANEVIERIKKTRGSKWRSNTVDTFKGGDPNTKVTGIAVTMMATMDVLQRAAAKGQNLIITHEPTFYDHLDTTKELPQGDDDPVFVESALSSKAIISSSGDFTITGTCAIRTEF